MFVKELVALYLRSRTLTTELHVIGPICLMVNVSSSYYVGTLVTETLYMCICRIKSLKAICFQIYLIAKNLKPSPLNYKSKTEKKEYKYAYEICLFKDEKQVK